MEDATTETDRNTTSANDLTVSAGDTIEQSTDKKFGTYSRDFERDEGDNLYHADGNETDIYGADAKISIVLWSKKEVCSAGEFAAMVTKSVGGADRSVAMDYHDCTSKQAEMFLSNDGVALVKAWGATTLQDGVWHHIAGVYNDVDIRVYVDGVLDSNGTDNPKSHTTGLFNSSQPFRIGAYGTATNNFYDGLLDDVGVFNVDLDATDINEIMDFGLLGSSIKTKRKAYLIQ